MAVDKWVKSGFTTGNRVRAPESTVVCEACVFVGSRISPVPGRPPAPGKKFGGNWRNYTHLGEVDGPSLLNYANATKAEHKMVVAFLRRPKASPWFAAIAESGQKHVLPWTPLNGPGIAGVVGFDDVQVRLPTRADGWIVVDDINALLELKLNRATVLSGRWTVDDYRKQGAEIERFEQRWRGLRGGDWFRLACHLAYRNKDTTT
jgi:hypothetical protein